MSYTVKPIEEQIQIIKEIRQTIQDYANVTHQMDLTHWIEKGYTSCETLYCGAGILAALNKFGLRTQEI